MFIAHAPESCPLIIIPFLCEKPLKSLLAVSLWLLALSVELSAISYQRSALSYNLCTVAHRFFASSLATYHVSPFHSCSNPHFNFEKKILIYLHPSALLSALICDG
jgi:hypothetical protein